MFARTAVQLGASVGHQARRSVCMSAPMLQKATDAKADPIQQLFLNKIREYAVKKKSSKDAFVDATSETKKRLDDELTRLARVYSVKDGQSLEEAFSFKFQDKSLGEIDIPDTVTESAVAKAEEAEISEVDPEETYLDTAMKGLPKLL